MLGELRLFRAWKGSDTSLILRDCLRPLIQYDEDGRSHGFIYSEPHKREWPEPLQTAGVQLLDDLGVLLSVRFSTVSFQAYRDHQAWCDWHTDAAGEQAVLSLGATRVLELRPPAEPRDITTVTLRDGDLAYEPHGFQQRWLHRVPRQDEVADERIALVFRTESPWG